jgi:D-amino-acid dehydrogenase
MKVAVIGAGVIGVTTAYELAEQGHEVIVYERGSAAAELCSFANAGVISPGYVTPWAKPGMSLHVLSHLWQSHTPVRLSRPSWNEALWLWKWWRACQSSTFTKNRQRLLRLSTYSQQRLQSLTQRLNLDYDRTSGYLVLMRGEKEYLMTQPSLEGMRDAGLSFEVLTAEQARQIEPALNPSTPLALALHFPNDEVANCRQFTLLLKNITESMGVQFHFNANVLPLKSYDPKKIRLTIQDPGTSFDAVVICAGLASANLLSQLKLKIPLAAVHGYSISASIREPLDAPRSGVMDERFKVAISRLGQRVRVSGSAEIGGDPRQHHAASLKTLYRVLDDWFPGAARTQDNVQVWKGSRPMLPDGPPVLGPSGIPGVWLNLGHGSSGWALSCGSARALADSLSGRQTDIDIEGLGIERLNFLS